MTICDYVIFFVLVLFMIVGFLRGILRELCDVLFFALPIGLGVFATPYVVDFLEKNQLLLPTLQKMIEGKALNNQYVSIFFADNKLGMFDLSELFTMKLSYYIVFALIYIFTYIIVTFIVLACKILEKVPILKGFNRFLGAIVGLIKGIVAVSMLMFILSILYVNFGIGGAIIDLINAGSMSSLLYQSNIIVLIIEAILR